MFTQKSFILKEESAEKKWHLIDAKDMIVGRLATEVADLLRGKRNPQYTPNTDSGDFVVVVNVDKMRLTGDKLNKKIYYWHTNHIGGLKQRTARELMEKHPDRVLMTAVKGMLPKNSLGRRQLKKLRMFTGEEHTHQAQKPEVYEIR